MRTFDFEMNIVGELGNIQKAIDILFDRHKYFKMPMFKATNASVTCANPPIGTNYEAKISGMIYNNPRIAEENIENEEENNNMDNLLFINMVRRKVKYIEISDLADILNLVINVKIIVKYIHLNTEYCEEYESDDVFNFKFSPTEAKRIDGLCVNFDKLYKSFEPVKK